MKPIRRVLVANRGEIAVRVIRACRALGIEAYVAVSEADRAALPARLADRAICIGPAAPQASYLAIDKIVHVALASGCDAVHPGYGFLSERAAFQRRCAQAGLVFIGPSAEAIEAMGDKIRAIATARRVGVPVVPGRERIAGPEDLRAALRELGFPCLLKAAAGGGGRGMRVIRVAAEAQAAFAAAQAEAKAAFGDGTLYLERYVENARHIEIQVLGDHHGAVRHLFERDCSVQRRHQKLIEESPAPGLPVRVREEMAKAAVALAEAVGYTNAGTVEFVYDVDGQAFYFLEMNTRIQVEHPVTEAVTGVDLVRSQIEIAAGKPLNFSRLAPQGHAIECRINAEDAALGFRPRPGRITRWAPPAHPNVRLDTHCFEGYVVPPYYDSLLAKVIVHAKERGEALAIMAAYLAAFRVEGVASTIDFQRRVLLDPRFARGPVTTTWLERTLERVPHDG